MAPTVRYDQGCTQEFQQDHGAEFTAYMRNNAHYQTRNGQAITWDEAIVMNGLHPGNRGRHDPNPADHSTVRLSNATLRAQGIHYTLHWRTQASGEPSVIMPNPETEVKKANKRKRDKEKKLRQKKRKDDEKRGPGGGMGGTGLATRAH